MARRAGLLLAIAALVAVALLAGRIALLLIAIVVAGAAAGEMFRLLRARGALPSAPLGYAGILALLIVAYVRGERAPAVFPVVIAAALGLAFAVMLMRLDRVNVTRAVAFTLLPVVTVGLLGAYVIALRSAPGGFRLAWVFALMAAGAELGAVSITWVFRRGTLTPRARRTWEHYLGAAAGALVAALVAALTAKPPFTWPTAIVLGALVAASVATGDIAWAMFEDDLTRDERGVRRARPVVLRRIDGVLLSAPVFFYAFRVLAR
jgi:CDP-diglyceride synthetase